ncbi:PREDICTED: acidic repeat-containing protein [Tinamus guttatus]|uniref:acidic repeat-containing protein n=1 Tax=Tinamus guttatus TaxID=94827 RepID=UPI00052F3D56|nr:PREDICTED: acidic repeat-containing protein [Tinamus guttatus]
MHMCCILTLHFSSSSDDEFEMFLVKMKTPKSVARPVSKKQDASLKDFIDDSDDYFLDLKKGNSATKSESRKPSCEGAQPSKGEEDKKPKSNSILLEETPSRITSSVRSSGSESGSCTPSTQTKEKCKSCSVPGCFLQDLSNPTSQYVKYFKKNKEDLTQKLYRLYNNTIFERKLPEKMEINWNKKMRKTAGYCVTGQTKSPEVQRYARIELSEKVCDSADRLRDTLIHEICHAATWLINGVRDGHGRFWRFYAKKSALIHPELPMVTRCHTYEIKYKFTYECVSCKNTIGRHSKSLDTERFVCAQCGGQLVLAQKDGAPARTQLTPFAKYVKENYGSAKKEQGGLSHVEVMRKLSVDFALKTRLQDSL